MGLKIFLEDYTRVLNFFRREWARPLRAGIFFESAYLKINTQENAQNGYLPRFITWIFTFQNKYPDILHH